MSELGAPRPCAEQGSPSADPTALLGDVTRVAEAALPTGFGDLRVIIFRVAGVDAETVALVRSAPAGDAPSAADLPLVRLHSECLTGDVLRSRRCDCGEQLATALSLIARSPHGVLLYLRQEGRGIGLANKIRAYALQDAGLDTVDANTALGLPVDGREYAAAAAILRHLGLTRVRLLTNNPAKCQGLAAHGVEVAERVPLEVFPNPDNLAYLRVKATRLGHWLTVTRGGRPSVTIHYAQTLDGRIATRNGSSQWISGEASLRLAHELRASHDAVLVGVSTVVADNPRLTVRLVPGRSPRRIVVDSTLRLPLDAHVLVDAAAPTAIATTARASAERIRAVRERGVEVLVVDHDPVGRVDLGALFDRLAGQGIGSALIEGGRELITSALRGRHADRLVVCTAPKVLGAGIEAVGDLDIRKLSEALTFTQASFRTLGEDVIFDGRLDRSPPLATSVGARNGKHPA